jgi:hypothetical protein
MSHSQQSSTECPFIYIYLFQGVYSLYLLQLACFRYFPSVACTYLFVIFSTRGFHTYMYLRTHIHTHTTYLILFESFRLLTLGTNSLTLGLLDCWMWDYYIVSKWWVLITQWHSTTFHKNGDPCLIQMAYLLSPEFLFVKVPKQNCGNITIS